MPTPEILAARQALANQAAKISEVRNERNEVAAKHSEELSHIYQRQSEEMRPIRAQVEQNEDLHEDMRCTLMQTLPRTALQVLSEMFQVYKEVRNARLKPKSR